MSNYCYDCGAKMVPEAYGPDVRLPGWAGYPAGAVVDGQVWVRCPEGHRGGWRDADQDHVTGLAKPE